MLALVFIAADGRSVRVLVPGTGTLRDAAPPQLAFGDRPACGDIASCAACHCYPDAGYALVLPCMSEAEALALEGVHDRRPNSRLACQIPLTPELDGLTVRLPARS